MNTEEKNQLMLASLKLLDTMTFNESIENMFEDDEIIDNYPFDKSYVEYISDFISKLEEHFDLQDCITFKELINYKLRHLSVTFTEKMLEIKDENIRNFITNLLISYKCLMLLYIKNKLKNFDKTEIQNLKLFAKEVINYYLRTNSIIDEEKTNEILIEFENNINHFLCSLC